MSTVFDALAPLVKRFEGLRLKAYLCPAGIPTVGYGHTKGVALGQTVDQLTADKMLDEDMTIALAGALLQCPSLATVDTNKQAAIADFVFNLGAGRLKASTLRHRINSGDWAEAVYELRRWVRGGGRILPGLVLRREAEVTLIGEGEEV